VLRIRESGGRFTQTVKSEGDPGQNFARGEWEDPVEGLSPDPAAAQSGHFLSPDIAGRLIPIFRTEVRRHVFLLSPEPEARVEAAVDRGEIVTVAGGSKGEPISELELELKAGRATLLHELALHLLGIAPLRLDRRSKAERGYRLVWPELDETAAVHAKPLELDPDMTGGEVLQRIGVTCLDQIMRNEPAVLIGNSDGIHQMRVGIRRLRAILSAFRRMLPADQRRRASDELRWLADALGAARNLDVFESAVVAAARDAASESGLAALGDAAEARRKAAYAAAAQAVGSQHYTAMLLHLLRWFEGEEWRHASDAQRLDAPIKQVAAEILDRRRRAAKRRSKHFGDQDAAERHRLRIALKKLRYAAEALGGLYPEHRVERFIKGLKKLQDDLGTANDVRVGHDIVAELAASAASAGLIAAAGTEVLDWHERRLAKHEPKLRRHLERMLEAKPFWHR
jgi:inorganic triphosphatase YgiF